MALIQCEECEKQISDRAEACPHCGVPLGAQSATPVSTHNRVQDPQDTDPELQALLSQKRYAKSLLSTLKAKDLSSVYSKYHNASESGLRFHYQVQWIHGILEDHDRDQDVEVRQSKSYGTTRSGHRYVQDVNTNVDHIKHDILTIAIDEDQEKSFRVTNLDLDKKRPGEVISLGFMTKSKKVSQDGKVLEEPTTIGWEVDKEVQPCMIVNHGRKPSQNTTFEALPTKKFKDTVVSTSIGFWHIGWLSGAALLYQGIHPAVGGSLAAISVGVKLVRMIKGNKQFEQFAKWYTSLWEELCSNESQNEAKMIEEDLTPESLVVPEQNVAPNQNAV